MSHRADPSATAVDYETDAYSWALKQATALKAARIEDLDLPNLARTLDNLVEQENGKLEAALEQIVDVLLKWDHRPEARSRNWTLTLHQQRRRIIRQMRRQPSMRSVAPDMIDRAFTAARAAVIKDLNLYDDVLPATCPYDWEHIMDRAIEWS